MKLFHASICLLVLTAGYTHFSSAQDDLAPKVLELFEKRCRECHHPDTAGDSPDLHKGINLTSLFANPDDYLDAVPAIPGDPDRSGLIQRVGLGPEERRRMPKSKGAKGDEGYLEPLSADEKKLLRDWIAALPKSAAVVSGNGTSETAPATPSAATLKVASVEQDAFPASAPLEQQIRHIFENRCAECHHPADTSPDLSATAKLDLLFTPDPSGQTPAAAILDRVTREDGDKERMPRSAGKPGDPKYTPPLAEIEVTAIRQWVQSAKASSKKRDILDFRDAIRRIQEDLSVHPTEGKFFRYLTLTHLHNAVDADGTPQVDDATMDSHRAGIGKLINSLSLHGRVTFPEAIDPEKTIYRIDLRDYKWSTEDWERVVTFYPHGILGIDRQKETLIARETGSRMAYLRADWFAFAASQPPLYDDILDYLLGIHQVDGDDDIVSRLEHRLGVDRVHHLQQGEAIRAGFFQSGVSEANRLIERHELGSHRGAYWISYDFKRQAADARDDLKRAPLGPKEAELTKNIDHIFDHDGGEIIYSLPNGLQAYLLATAAGKRLDRAPIEIVQDGNHPENIIINGISCIRCHDQGMKAPLKVPVPANWSEGTQGPKPNTLAGMRDEVAPAVAAAGILDFRERGHLEKLYPQPEVLRSAVLGDFDRFTQAEKEATGGLRGALEPVSGLFQEYQRMVDARRLSAELGLSHEEVIRLLGEEKDRSEALAVLHLWMGQGQAERREALMRDYLSLVYALGFELLPFEPLGYEEFGGQAYADLIRQSPEFVAAFGAAPQPVQLAATDVKKALTTSTAARVNLTRDTVPLPDGGSLEVTIQPKLVVGDTAELVVKTTRDVHVLIVHHSADQFVTELYPGTTGKPTLLKAGAERVVQWETTEPGGPESVIVYSSSQPIRNTTRGGQAANEFTVFERRDFFSSRGVPKNVKAADASPQSARPAPMVEARVGYFLQD